MFKVSIFENLFFIVSEIYQRVCILENCCVTSFFSKIIQFFLGVDCGVQAPPPSPQDMIIFYPPLQDRVKSVWNCLWQSWILLVTHFQLLRLKRAATDSNCGRNKLRLKQVLTDSSCGWNELRLKQVASKTSSDWLQLWLTPVAADSSGDWLKWRLTQAYILFGYFEIDNEI